MPLALAALFSTAGTSSADGPMKLGITAVGTNGSNFKLTMQPGETRGLAVNLSNYGADTVTVRTFAADAYSMVNGGFAVRLDGEPSSGTTSWVTYTAGDLDLTAGTETRRDLTVSVPVATPPGEYQTSLVLQNATAVSTDDTATQTGMVLKQIIRQVSVLSIDVPGLRTPALELGPITHSIVAERSRIAVGVHNLGNVRLKPTGEFVLWDSTGIEVTRFPLSMDTVYSHTDTTAEIPFTQRLNAGDYTAQLQLTDAGGFTVTSSILLLTIPGTVTTDTPPQDSSATPAQVQTNQTPTAAAPASAVATNPLIIALIAFGAGLGLMLTVFGVGFAIYRRRRRKA